VQTTVIQKEAVIQQLNEQKADMERRFGVPLKDRPSGERGRGPQCAASTHHQQQWHAFSDDTGTAVLLYIMHYMRFCYNRPHVKPTSCYTTLQLHNS
jgi:hypothetical protein